ncbi:MAG: SDR family NAD(P)-dependent oxidoreductase [Rhodospirillales bacterium]
MADRGCAVIAGVGPGLGASLVRAFAAKGFNIAAASRRVDALTGILGEVSGVETRAYGCDVSDEADVDTLFERAEADLGPVEVAIFNAGSRIRGGLLELSSADFEQSWRIGCLGGFHVGKAAASRMLPRARGTILFTGATAALRGGAGFLTLAVPKFGVRALAQSMARELGPQGLHVAHVIIDGQILSDRHAELARQRPEDGLLSPDAIAAEYVHLHEQPRSSWTQELDLRPWVEKF